MPFTSRTLSKTTNNNMKLTLWVLNLGLICCLVLAAQGYAATGESTTSNVFLPLVSRSGGANYEIRALWVSRYDWTFYSVGTQATIETIVKKAAKANFNVILFQVRGTGDAFYTPGLEPWSMYLNSDRKLGKNPGWDPLAYMIEQAHNEGIQVHAYINAYPIWAGTTAPSNSTSPLHPYWSLTRSDGSNWQEWDQNGPVGLNSSYLFGSPGAKPVADHIEDVVQDILNRYDVDGIHLDYIRYSGPKYSCDPYSEDVFRADCFSSSPAWEKFQRAQVSALVETIYNLVPADMPLSAAVFPVFVDRWGWGFTEGKNDYYQNSQGWGKSGIIDALFPMIYPANYASDNWPQWRFEILVNDYIDNSGGANIVAGIGGGYDDFEEIADRIEIAREAGAAGQAIFSYSGLLEHSYFDDLKDGPYAEPAQVPPLLLRR